MAAVVNLRRRYPMDTLPHEVLLAIFKFVGSAEDLLSLSLVCVAFQRVASDEILWQPLCASEWEITQGYKAAYLDWLRRAVIAYRCIEPPSPPLRSSQGYSVKSSSCDACVSLGMIGPPGVGKTTFLNSYCGNGFLSTHIRNKTVDYHEIDGLTFKIKLRHNVLSPFEQGILLMYDVTRRHTFDDLDDQLDQLQYYVERNCVILIGTKADRGCKRQVTCQEGAALAQAHGIEFFETSGKTGHNVKAAVFRLAVLASGGGFADGLGPKPPYVPSSAALQRMGIKRGDRARKKRRAERKLRRPAETGIGLQRHPHVGHHQRDHTATTAAPFSGCLCQ